MLTHDYSYAAALEGSVTHAWTVDDCFQFTEIVNGPTVEGRDKIANAALAFSV